MYLDVGATPAVDDGAAYAWYSTVGEIVQYQSNPTWMDAADAPAEGWLFVVVRASATQGGGVGVRAVRMVVGGGGE